IMPTDLNVTLTHRLTVALVCAIVLLGAIVIARNIMGLPYHSHLAVSSVWLAAVAAGLLLYLNLDLYRFFARQRGLLFAARALPMHWLYYCYCGDAAAAGL